jgi:hypothetical protein
MIVHPVSANAIGYQCCSVNPLLTSMESLTSPRDIVVSRISWREEKIHLLLQSHIVLFIRSSIKESTLTITQSTIVVCSDTRQLSNRKTRQVVGVFERES